MKHFNFILIVATIVVLAAIGVVFVGGTLYSYQQSILDSNWTQTYIYQNYLAAMTSGILPLVIALIIILGMCIPKRLFSGRSLLALMGGLSAASLAVALVSANAKSGLVFLMAAAIVIQVVVLVLTLAGNRALGYERQGFFLQVGSALLHLGLVVFLVDFMAVPTNSPNHLMIFWFATGLIGVGMAMSFYAQELARLLRMRRDDKDQAEDLDGSAFDEADMDVADEPV